MNIAVIQARMSSLRFPGKIVKPILGEPLLTYLVNRIRLSKKIDKIIIATTKDKSDNIIEDLSNKLLVECFRGEIDNVLSRFYHAVCKYNPNTVLRITADCPLVDPKHCDLIIETLSKNKADFVCLGQTYAEGADCAIFTFKALEQSYKYSTNPLEKEHITLYIHNNQKKYRKIIIENNRDDSQFRFTVDEPQDLMVVQAILIHFQKSKNQYFSYQDIINFLNQNPKIVQLNSLIIRNEGYLKSLTQNTVKDKQNVLFRVDGSKIIGWGHVLRCIGIAEEFKKQGYNPIFIIKSDDDEVLAKVDSSGFEIELLPKNANYQKQIYRTNLIIDKCRARTLIVDLSNLLTLKMLGWFTKYINSLNINNIVIIDGYGSECIVSKVNIEADIVIVPYYNAQKNSRFKNKKSINLLGVQYAVIRNEFLRLRQERKVIKKIANNILVLPGGSINSIFLIKILNSFKLVKSENLTVKILTKDKKASSITQKLRLKKIKFQIIYNLSQIAPLYNWADLAISASGLTMYELAFMGLPAIVVSHNDVHKKITDNFSKAGSIIHIGTKKSVSEKRLAKAIDDLILDKNKRDKMSHKGIELVDGKGVKRIALRIIMKELL